jgi:hypothetical protein
MSPATSGLYWDDMNKRMGIGAINPATDLHISRDALLNPALTLDGASDNATTKGMVLFVRSRGSHAVPAAVQANDWLGQFTVNGHNGTAYEGARRVIQFEASENWTPSAGGYRVIFYTRDNGTVGPPTESLRVDHNGNVGVGTTAPTQALEVNGGVRMNSGAAQPVCDVNSRGTIWVVQGVSSDTLQVCILSSGNYVWRTIAN